MTSRWVPPEDRNRFVARSYFGTNIGLVITYPLCGILVDTWGWESAFYVIAGITGVWSIFWFFLVFDTPDKHPRITEKERLKITESLKDTVNANKGLSVPWLAILTSLPFIGLVCSDCSNTYGFNTLASTPTYFKYMLGVDVKANGILSALPNLFRYLGCIVTSEVTTFIMKRKEVKLVWVRRICNVISEVGPALAMFIVAFSGCNIKLGISLLCLGYFFNGGKS